MASALISPLPSIGCAEGVDDAAEQRFADRHLEQPAGGADFVALLDGLARRRADAADLGFLEVQRQAVEAAGELDHLVEHDVAEAFDLGDAVTDLADDADVRLGDRGLEAGDLGFQFLQDVAHAVGFA